MQSAIGCHRLLASSAGAPILAMGSLSMESRMTMSRLLLLSLVALVAPALLAPAQATSANGIVAQRQWSTMDRCAKLAITKFPDHTAAELAKRDDFIHKCQRDANVPVREGLTPK
jgi:hypothetical protein